MAAQDASGAIPVLSGDLFKQTVAFDYVVKRHVRLFSDRFETYEDPKDNPGDHRSFPLDASARLLPASKEGITQKRRHLRPRGVGSMTALAAVRGKGAPLELVSAVGRRLPAGAVCVCVFGVGRLELVRAVWQSSVTGGAFMPSRQVSRGLRVVRTHSIYMLTPVGSLSLPDVQWTFKLKREEHSDFTFCFTDRDTAWQWHDALTQVQGAAAAAAAAVFPWRHVDQGQTAIANARHCKPQTLALHSADAALTMRVGPCPGLACPALPCPSCLLQVISALRVAAGKPALSSDLSGKMSASEARDSVGTLLPPSAFQTASNQPSAAGNNSFRGESRPCTVGLCKKQKL